MSGKRKYGQKRKVKEGFEFVSPYSLEQCIDRLTQIQELRGRNYDPKIKIAIDMVDSNTYSFRIHETHPGFIKLHGFLIRREDTTYISGDANIATITYFEAIPIFGLIGLLSVIVSWVIGFLLLLPLYYFVIRIWRGAEREEERLVRLTETMLSY